MLIAGAISRGLQMSDLDNMTVGGLVDYVIVYNNMHTLDEDKEPTVRQATQEDFDRF